VTPSKCQGVIRPWRIQGHPAAGTAPQGCSVSRVAYNNADVVLRWQADHYFDLEGEPAEQFDRRLAALLARHRTEAQPHNARHADAMAARLQRGIKRQDLEWSYDALREQIRQTLVAAAGESAGLLDRLTPEQIEHFERRLAEDNRKFAKEEVGGSLEQQRKRRMKRNLERLEEWFGPLDEAQEERLRQYNARAPLTGALRERDRKRRQAEFLAMLRAREAGRRLAPWLERWESDREPAYAQAMHATRNEYMHLLLDLDRTLSAEQRAHAVARLRRFGELFDSLAGAP
jgi:hypothetical protein